MIRGSPCRLRIDPAKIARTCEPADGRWKRDGDEAQPRWPWLRLFRIIELEVVVYELRPKLLRLLRELDTLRVDFCDTGRVFHFVNHVSIGHRHDIAGDESGSREQPGRAPDQEQ